jgi:hypothetical protein
MRRVFTLKDTAARHPAVAAWFEEHPGPLGEIAAHWFGVLRQCGSDVTEVLHDYQPTACVGGAAFAYVAAFTSHVNVGFFQGATLPDPAGLLQGSGRFMRHVKLRPGMAVDEGALSALIAAAYRDVQVAILSPYT